MSKASFNITADDRCGIKTSSPHRPRAKRIGLAIFRQYGTKVDRYCSEGMVWDVYSLKLTQTSGTTAIVCTAGNIMPAESMKMPRRAVEAPGAWGLHYPQASARELYSRNYFERRATRFCVGHSV